MIFIQKLAVLFFNLIDRLIHQKKILHFLKQERVQIDTWFDIGSHKGLYTDLIKNNVKKIYSSLSKKNTKVVKIFIYLITLYLIHKKHKIFILINTILHRL